MLIALICTDKPNNLETRLANRDAHVAYLKSTDAVVQAGPFLDESGDMSGSLIVLDVPDMDAAHAWAAADPYAQAGLFSEVRLEQWNKVIG
ncbi:YciI family protein [Litoreibacter arenae]|uniref:YciL protein n=1 Tax=Litoreibacter arenae DSM 19593 TaxID=1123360 RepID=S9RTU2_9RHOB|nr:YciI family protein [Litoreibacter arenae]EPX77384.1 YciL protein [Litoreibacter arenae DSM 19593]